MKRIILFGNNEVASANYYHLTHDSEYQVAAFTVDKEFIKEDSLHGLPVLPFESIESICPPGEYAMALPLGFKKMNRFRMEKCAQAKAKGFALISYVSSKAVTWKGLSLGENSFIYDNSFVGAFAQIGNNVILSPGCNIGHHSEVGDHCFVASDAVVLGQVRIGPFCVIGGNATITDRVTVAAECIIAAGVTITKDTKEKGVYINRPAELVPKSSDELSALLTWPVK
ncbi:MAG: acetyltransferase [Thermodesulfovibrionales bacterium]|jgi:sugar O-acyltransferase (sialic acid O-acetyltransferase NeuD family)